MKFSRQALRRIGGPDAVTWPAFWASLVANLVGQFSTGGQVDAPTWVRLLAVMVSQVAMFVPLLLLRFTLLKDPNRPHPWIAVAGFALAPLVRTPVLVAVLVEVGGVTQPQLLQRLLGAFVNIFLVLLITALVVSSLRDQARTLQTLLSVQRDLELTRAQVETQVQERNEAALQRVRATLEEELQRLGAPQGDAVRDLQRLATDVVRPMSHDLAQSVPSWQPPEADTDIRIRRRDLIRAIGARGPFQPLATAVVETAIIIVPSSTFLVAIRIPVLLTASIGIFVTLTCANLILNRVLPRSTPTRSFVAVLTAAIACSALQAGPAGFLLGGTLGRALAIGGMVFLTGLSMMAAIIGSALSQQREAEAELRLSTEMLRVNLARLHQVQWYQQKALSRALHGPMQSAATAAALRLDAAVRSGQASGGLVKEVRDSLRQQIDVLGVDEPQALDVAQVFDRITGTWEGLCEVAITADAQARRSLEADPVLRSIATEIVSEAVSNAIRHGHATKAEVAVTRPNEAALLVSVIDDGQDQGDSSRSGLGSQLLDECTTTWSLESTEHGRRLLAELPLDPQSLVVPA
ncbi:MAG: hypothetical protein KGN78_08260 [Actinomycetales bacterium]|nr:hypothetical protein [Actinomycetales bacterium]